METLAHWLFGPEINGGHIVLAWVQVVVMIVVAIIAAFAMQPKTQQPKAATIDDFDMPTAEDGKEAPVMFGDNWTEDPNVLWYGDLSTRPVKAKSK
ncbi:hypothetical protein DLP3_022 [Stenotrophomonas phage vB_SmaS_DLP_3]|nr:hypothetical protein DLP3_022 [Stenotrophomonas phage vB_SmaS_DLP_3]